MATGDLTVVYYTANQISETFARAVRERLLDALDQLPYLAPIISVSQRPIAFGRNLRIGDVGASIWHCYHQVLLGAQAASTPYVALCEDDTLYVAEHFLYRPPAESFGYNRHRWVLDRDVFYLRDRTQLAMCIAPRALLIDALEERFSKWPKPIVDEEAKRSHWGEPGRYETHQGLKSRPRVGFYTQLPCVTVNHAGGLMGRRARQMTDSVAASVEPWGEASELWRALRVES